MKLFKKTNFIIAMAALAFTACEDVPAPYTVPGENNGTGLPEGTYINESFASDFGTFSTAETVGNYPWVIDYSTAKATSYDSESQTNNPAESWLISAPVDFTDETEAYVNFEYIIRYAESGKVAANHQLLVSTDYTGDPATATWKNIDYNAVEGTDWTTFYTATENIPEEFMGKPAVTFALKYTATTKSATWEVKNFTVEHGKAEETTTPETKEYTVAQALAAYTDGQQIPAVVTAYIVGTIDGKSIDGALFSGSATITTNLLIADNADETDINKCIPVQLPSGNVRNALNLVDNPTNYKKQVKLTGSIEKYFSVGGLKSVTAYEFTSNGGNTENPDTPDGVSNIADVIAAGASDATTVQGTITATYSRGFIINDGTASILVYLGEDKGFRTGDVVTVSGSTSLYGGLLQFGNTATVEKTGTATVETPATTTWTGNDMDSYINAPEIKYVQYTGKLTISGYYYNVQVDGASTAIGSIAYPAEGLVDSSLDGKNITVTGYAIGVSSSKYINTMAVSVVAADGDDNGNNEEEENNGSESGSEAVVFDFTAPTALNPSVTPSEEVSTGVEFEDITFTNGNISIHAEKGSAGYGARIWTKTDGTYEFRAYNGSTITISTADGSNMSSIEFQGGKITTMQPDKGTFNAGAWSGNSNSVTFSVTGTLYIKNITVK